MRKKYFPAAVLMVSVLIVVSIIRMNHVRTSAVQKVIPPLDVERYNEQWEILKKRKWTVKEAANHHEQLSQRILRKSALCGLSKKTGTADGTEVFADGALVGRWKSRGPYNMPGAWLMVEMDDGTDTVYGVTCGHLGGYQFIHKGTLAGNDFVLLSGKFPTRYEDLLVIPYNNGKRLIAGIENGSIAYSDDNGQNWTFSTGLLSNVTSTIANRQDGFRIYTTDNRRVYLSENGATSFRVIKDFATSEDSKLYTPRYAMQPNASAVYLARASSNFYLLNSSRTDFVQRGSITYLSSGGDGYAKFCMGGDSRKLYITRLGKFLYSTDEGVSWQQISPPGYYYEDQTEYFPTGQYIGVNPENPEIIIGGYTVPLYSSDGFKTVITGGAGWGMYQVEYVAGDPDARIRRRYHPDYQDSRFFYNKAGELISLRASDGGIFMSKKEWLTPPVVGDYPTDIFLNITLYNTPTQEAYPADMAVGARHPDHIFVGTQDQGWQATRDTGYSLIRVDQVQGGDGWHIISGDGETAWTFRYEAGGAYVYPPYKLYTGNTFTHIENLNQSTGVLIQDGNHQFPNAFADRYDSRYLWILERNLSRVSWDGSTIQFIIKDFGGNSTIAAVAQSALNPNLVVALENGKMYKSLDRGTSWDAGVNTGIGSNNYWDKGGAWISSTDDNIILLVCHSTNGTVSVLSKDGGKTWKDVSTGFINTNTNGFVGTPDGKFVFASTQDGPFVFDMQSEKWFELTGEKSPIFWGHQAVYIPSTNTVRFSTLGQGLWDFMIGDASELKPYVKVISPVKNTILSTIDTLHIRWTTNLDEPLTINIISSQGSKKLSDVNASTGEYTWIIPNDYVPGGYQVEIKGTISDTVVGKSELFSITTVGIAYKKPVTATASATNFSPDCITDGATGGLHWDGGTAPQSITIDLLSNAVLDSIAVYPYVDNRYYQYSVETSKDNANWTLVADMRTNTVQSTPSGETHKIPSTNGSVRYVKVTMTFNSANASVHLHEVRVFGNFTSGNKMRNTLNEVAPYSIRTYPQQVVLTVHSKGMYTLGVYALNGRKVLGYANQGVGALKINRSEIGAGVYIVHIDMGKIGRYSERIEFK